MGVFVWVGLVDSGRALTVGEDQADHSMMHLDRAPMVESVGQMGRRRSGSAVYLGKGWILTAYHAFQGRTSNVVIFSGVEYPLRSGAAVRLKNPSGSGASSGTTDLVLVPLKSAPQLPELEIDRLPPFAGEQVVMVGYGETLEADDDILVRAESKDEFRQTRAIVGAGFEDEVAGPRWGENTVTDRGLMVGIAGSTSCTIAYATVRQPGSVVENAQGASGDSGGGVFVRRGEGWQLSGVMLSVLVREDLDASATFIADLSVYRDQIVETIPEPSVGLLLVVAGVCGVLRRRR